MKSLNVPGYDIRLLEQQYAVKKAEYFSAIRNGEIFDDLKIKFLELKKMQTSMHQSAIENFPLVEMSRRQMEQL